jgi:hypothetical protein
LRTELLRAEAQLERADPEEYSEALLRYEDVLYRFSCLVLGRRLPGHLDGLSISSDQSTAQGFSSLDLMEVLQSLYREKEFLDEAIARLERTGVSACSALLNVLLKPLHRSDQGNSQDSADLVKL